jgi:hypothetical protein
MSMQRSWGASRSHRIVGSVAVVFGIDLVLCSMNQNQHYSAFPLVVTFINGPRDEVRDAVWREPGSAMAEF